MTASFLPSTVVTRLALRVLLGAAFLACTPARAQVVVDGVLGEWDAPLYADATGDGSTLDLGRLWGGSDVEYLYLAFETGAEVGLQNFNSLTLYLDTDDDPATGEPVAGIGAEVRYVFGARSGVATLSGRGLTALAPSDLGFISAPTVTADRFEVAVRRGTTVGGAPLFPGSRVRVVLVDGTGGDVLPDEPGGVLLSLRDDPPVRRPVELARRAPGDLRVLTYNVLGDGLFREELEPQYRRLLAAIDPDVVAVQEVYRHDAGAVAARMSALLPGTEWYGGGVEGSDVAVVARLPVISTASLCARPDVPTTCNVAVHLGPGARAKAGLYVVSMHPPCCTNDIGRQVEFDLLAAHLRDVRASGALPPETPVVVAGDMNLVGDRRQVQTLLTGAIVDVDRFGPGAPLDVDGTALADAAPPTTGRPADFTWINDGDTYPPGRLDYVVFSDALLEARNGFALYTPGLTPEELTHYGLEAGDSAVSDHLPVVQDLAARVGTSVDGALGAGGDLGLPSPNPVRDLATVRYRLDRPGRVRLVLLDALGRVVRVVEDAARGAGPHAAVVDVSGLAAGAYVLQLEAGGRVSARGLAVAR